MSHEHRVLDRFPTPEEAHRIAWEWQPGQLLDQEEIGLRLGRMLAEASHTSDGSTLAPAPTARPRLTSDGVGFTDVAGPASVSARLSVSPQTMDDIRCWVSRLLRSSQRVRKDHRQLSAAERERFNQALQESHTQQTYQQLAAIHADMSHRMHTMPGMGPEATQRFLPWHRAYTWECENLLRTYQPEVTIPYWDYAEDHARPDWVWQPPDVDRPPPGALGGLPTPATVNGLLIRPTFTSFTFGTVTAGTVRADGLEFVAHNNVHMWCGGTVSQPPTAPQDPIFWLLHGNVDRLWDRWQLTHCGAPDLTGADAGLDPWWSPATGGTTAPDVRDITVLGYSYQ